MTLPSSSFLTDRPARVGNVVLGRAPVKIIASVCAVDESDMLEQAKAIAASCADILEWRADHFDEKADWPQAVRAMKALAGKPILYTLRTRAEGGAIAADPSDAAYGKKVRAAIESGLFDAVDIEVERDGSDDLVEAAHRAGLTCIMSWHCFESARFAPDERDAFLDGLFFKLEDMERAGADVLKIAVMPSRQDDIVRFMSCVNAYLSADKPPLIAMCMGKGGAVTRAGASLFGSCATFASAAVCSAPGQLDAQTTRRLLDLFTDEAEQA